MRTWIDRNFEAPDQLHLSNLITGPLVLALFLWAFGLGWWVVPASAFVGAAVYNSALGLLVRRDMRRLESADEDRIPKA